jgi:hypothetical protein
MVEYPGGDVTFPLVVVIIVVVVVGVAGALLGRQLEQRKHPHIHPREGSGDSAGTDNDR